MCSAQPKYCLTKSGALACSLGYQSSIGGYYSSIKGHYSSIRGHHSSIGRGKSWANPNVVKLLGQDIDL